MTGAKRGVTTRPLGRRFSPGLKLADKKKKKKKEEEKFNHDLAAHHCEGEGLASLASSYRLVSVSVAYQMEGGGGRGVGERGEMEKKKS